jgi:hypothetical protein
MNDANLFQGLPKNKKRKKNLCGWNDALTGIDFLFEFFLWFVIR